MNISIVILLALILTSGFANEPAYDASDRSGRSVPIPSFRPSAVGDPSKPAPPPNEPEQPEVPQLKPSEYGEPTGKWFRKSSGNEDPFSHLPQKETNETAGEGSIRFTVLPVHHPGTELQVRVDQAPPAHLKMRLQLTKRGTDFQRTALLKERTLTKNALWKLNLFPERLPDEDDSIYVVSAELLGEDGTVEDTATRTIVVPKDPKQSSPELTLNAGLFIGSSEYKPGDELIMTVKNAGSTTLVTGKYYQIEKLDTGKWRKITFDALFDAIAIYVKPGTLYVHSVHLPDLEEGRYRIVKTIQVKDTSMNVALAGVYRSEIIWLYKLN
ncbi:immunoglobulin-like domain-containing protein [Paenibacillus sp. MBLB4367]|uniref:immunoglobulin-like domain-containing protein n=1 Tax=Paenibacillus sp. MBLB4367 TaxID=3384767 RepID=UPI0039084019